MSAIVDRLRQPEYTDENRCVPCTVVNIVIAVVLAAVIAWGGFTTGGVTLGASAGGLVLLASLASIYLRGYLVPRTPTLTKRYFPEWLLAKFDTAEFDDGTDATGKDLPADIDLEATLLEAGVVEPCEQVDDLCLVEEFRTSWHDAMSMDADDRRSALAAQLDAAPDGLRIDEHGEAFVAHHDGRRVGQWESQAALLADLGAAETLPAWVDDWDRLPVTAWSQLLGGLRIFLERCPDCGGEVETGRETVESCCRSQDVVATECRDCGARLLEAPLPRVKAG